MKSPPITFLVIITLLVLLFSEPLVSVFISINCGSSESYTDENGIKWSGDDAYIQHGVAYQVKYLVSGPLGSLRAFPNRKKNCYSIGVPKGEKILARANFYYGDYDSKSSPPVFELQFDGNYWATVNTSEIYFVDFEAIYVTKGNSTSICVAQTKPDQIPFISTIEIRSLNPTMYSHFDYTSRALILQWRVAFGANDTIRYPNDVYDRIWRPAIGILLSSVASEASNVHSSSTEDQPPKAALLNAVTSSSTSDGIVFINRLPAEELAVYITTYFSELKESAVGKRSIQMYIDDKPFSSSVVPPFGGATELYITNMTASSNTSFVLRATSTSTLPPILNALEVYTLSGPFTAGTDARDVEGLTQLQLTFEVLLEWSGDPCLPYPFSWDWVQCTTDAKPRIIALYLSGYELRGILPDFSSMDALQTIDLQNNTIQGPIPDFLGLLPNLKSLNLSYNRFNGSVPTALKNKKIVIDTTNNCLSGMKCQPLIDSQPPPPPSQSVSDNGPNNPPPPPQQFFSGDEPIGPPPPPELFSGDGLIDFGGSTKLYELNISIILAIQISLPLLFMKLL